MIAKKNPKLNFEKKRFVFFQVGLITAGTMMLVAFRWSTPVYQSKIDTSEIKVSADALFELVAKPEPEKPEPTPVVQLEPTVVAITDNVNPVDDLTDVNPIEPLIIPLTNITVGTSTNLPPGDSMLEDEFTIVEEMPEFVGGDEAMMSYFRKSIKYPEEALKYGEQGKVYVKFLVTKDGTISNVQIARGVSNSLDQEALRVVKNMPKWKPGKQRGRAVNVWYVVPINFVSK